MALATPNPTVVLLENALQKIGYSVEKFTIANNSYTRYIAPSGHAWLTQDASVGYPFTSAAVLKIANQKNLAYELAVTSGVRIPKTTKVTVSTSVTELRDMLQNAPLVAKPHNASLSHGVSLGIVDEQQLQTAIKVGLQFSPNVLVQEQVDGEELRFAVIEGEVKAVLLREMPRLVGDGRSTIAELLKHENADRALLRMPYLEYPQLGSTLIADIGRSADDVLANGATLNLGRGTMVRTGASVYNVLANVHPSYLRTAELLAHKLGARFVVVDMMIHDYTEPQTADNYAFIEFNTAPVLKLFYSCRDGRHYDIIADLVPLIDATLKGPKL